MLVLSPDDEPTLLLPVLERPDAEAAEGAGSVSLVDWEDGTDPYEVAGPLLRPDGEFGISDSVWAMHVLGLQRALPKSSYRAITESLPMMRAVKDSNELMRLAAAGQPRTRPTARSCRGASLQPQAMANSSFTARATASELRHTSRRTWSRARSSRSYRHVLLRGGGIYLAEGSVSGSRTS